MRRIAVALLIGSGAVVGCRSATVSKYSPEPLARGATPKEEVDHLRLASERLDRSDETGAVPHLKAHLLQQPDAVMVRAYLGELLLKTGNGAEAKGHFERFTRDAAGATGPAHKHLVHVHTRLMEIAGVADDAFGEQLHRGIGLVLLVKQWDEGGEPADAGMSERTLVQAVQALKRADAEKAGDARVGFYLAEAYYALGQSSSARIALLAAGRCESATLNDTERGRLSERMRMEEMTGATP